MDVMKRILLKYNFFFKMKRSGDELNLSEGERGSKSGKTINLALAIAMVSKETQLPVAPFAMSPSRKLEEKS